MPDFTMCKNAKCPLIKTCGRFRAKPDLYQSFASFKPSIDVKGNVTCEYYVFWRNVRGLDPEAELKDEP